MNILIAGGTGLIGQCCVSRLLRVGHSVTLLSRNPAFHRDTFSPNVQLLSWDGRSVGEWGRAIEQADAVLNLSGESIGKGRWTRARKKLLLDSRLDSTRTIVRAIGGSSSRPSVLVNASAVGFYGDVPEGRCREDREPGTDFLAQICMEWEHVARETENYGTRVAIPRTGVVLDTEGGALAKLLLPFRLFLGGPLGSGRQWFPWVHVQDAAGAMIHALTTPSLSGPFNVAAPQYLRMKDFARVLGSVLKRPSWAPVPAVMLKLALGEMAGPLLLSGQQAVPDKLLESGFVFAFPEARAALEDLLT